MTDDEVRITLRLPRSLRDRLASAADLSTRSMNGEIVSRLELSFIGPLERHRQAVLEQRRRDSEQIQKQMKALDPVLYEDIAEVLTEKLVEHFTKAGFKIAPPEKDNDETD